MRTVRDDAVLPATRTLSIVIVPFLAVAFVVLYMFPEDTDRLFAWSTMTALHHCGADGWPESSPLSQRAPRAYSSSTSGPVSCGMSSFTS